MKKIEIVSRIEDCKIVRNRNMFIQSLQQFNNADVVITIQKKRIKRSNSQNAYYFGCIIPLVRDGLINTTGEIFDLTETHNFLKAQFCYKELINESTGEIVKIPKSTTDNSTTDAEIYYEQIRRFADDFLGVKIPLPNEDLKLEL